MNLKTQLGIFDPSLNTLGDFLFLNLSSNWIYQHDRCSLWGMSIALMGNLHLKCMGFTLRGL